MRITFIILLILSLLILSFKSGQHFSGLNLLKVEEYEWVENELSYISDWKKEKISDESSPPEIRLKIDTFNQYFSIPSDLNGSYERLMKHPKLNKLEKGVKLALQLKKYKLRTLETAFVYAKDPIVFGLVVEGELVFSVETINQKLAAKNRMLALTYLTAALLLLVLIIILIRQRRAAKKQS